MDEFKQGFKVAILSVIALCVAWNLKPELQVPFSPEDVQCFPMPSTAGLLPTVKSIIPMSSEEEFAGERQTMATYISGVNEAEESCTQQACEGAALDAYRLAISEYLLVREVKSRNKFREAGDKGLSAAAKIFDTASDAAVIRNLKSLRAAGLVDLASLGKAKQSAALLVLQPLKSYRPCADETPKSF